MPTRRARHRSGGRLTASQQGRQGTVVVAVALVAVLTAAVVALVLGGDRADRSTADGVLLSYRYASDPDALVAEVSP